MNIPIIVNRHSGRIDADDLIKKFESAFPEYSFTVHETEYSGHASLIARELLQTEGKYIIVAGGDGTLNEAIQPLVGSSKVMIPVPGGTGSDFCRTIGMDSMDTAVETLRNGSVISCDTVLCRWRNNRRYFLNILELGFGASVMERVNSKTTRNDNVFRNSVLRQLISLHNYDLEITVDRRKIKIETPEVVIANGRFFGGGMKASPDSSIDDGILDIHIIGKLGRISLLRKFSGLMDGSYIHDQKVSNFEASEIVVRGNCPVEMDGEVTGSLPLSMKVVQKSLLLAVPGSSQ